MDLILKTDKTLYRFHEPIRCTIARSDGQDFEGDYPNFYFYFLINGQEKYHEGVDRWAPGGNPVFVFQQSLVDDWAHLGGSCSITFQMKMVFGVYPEKTTWLTQPVELKIDLSGIEVMRTASGEMSWYIQADNAIYFVWPGSRGHARAHRRVAADRASAKVLSNQHDFPYYLVDAQAVYRDGQRLKGVDAKGFKILNAVFAGNSTAILTPYGDAKIAHPAQFEVLDDGHRYFFKQAGPEIENGDYNAGYGRDDLHVYWFDGSNSTAHAIVVKACQSPRSFVSLDNGYARDEKNIYLEGVALKGADPKTWRMLNRLYSRDQNHVFYLHKKIAGAHADSFKIMHEDGHADFDSHLARDDFHCYEAGIKISQGA